MGSRQVHPDAALLPGVSVVVPVYKGSDSIIQLADRLEVVLADGLAWELIFVVDGSPDDSWHTVTELVNSRRTVRGIELFRNFGQHNALLAGIREARYDVVVTMDDDLQHRPESIPSMLAALTHDIDLVYGTSDIEEHGAWRNLTSRVAKAAIGASIGSQMVRDSGAFRAFRTALRGGFSDVHDPYVSIDVVLSWTTTRYTTCPITMDKRTIGASGYSTRKLLRHAVNMVTGYSTKPLRMVTWLGLLLAAFGFGVLMFVAVRRFTSDTAVPGFAFVASLVAVLAGAQLFGLGIIGEYLGRMHVRSMRRPPYVIREMLDSEQPVHPEPDVAEL